MSDITIKNGECSAVINYHGAELKSLKKNGREYNIKHKWRTSR